MTDDPRGTTDVAAPLVTWRHRAGQRRPSQRLILPEVSIVVGRDHISSGATVSVWEPTDGEHPRYRVLWSARWLDPIVSTELALRYASNGGAAALAALFGPELPG